VTASLSRFRTHILPDVIAYVDEQGGDGAALLARCGLPAGSREQPWVDVSLDALHRFLDAAAAAARDPALGLHVGQRLTRRTWDALQLACRSSPTLGDALLRIPRLMPLFNDAIEIDIETGPLWHISHRIAGQPEGLSRHGNELWLSTLFVRAREETGAPITPVRCWFGHAAPPSPADLEEHRRVLGTERLDFGAGSTGFALPEAETRRPLLGADPVLAAVLDRLSAEALRAQGCRRGVAAQVYRLLREGLAGQIPAIGQIGKKLGLSERSLQRRLGEEGTSYRELVDQVRRDLARVLLAQEVPRDEIARRLAYAETASFTRSLSRWVRPPR
jgi:AraC-like DNA-binding protein